MKWQWLRRIMICIFFFLQFLSTRCDLRQISRTVFSTSGCIFAHFCVSLFNVVLIIYFIIEYDRIVRMNKCVSDFVKHRIYRISAMTKCARDVEVSRERKKIKSCLLRAPNLHLFVSECWPTNFCDAMRATGK